jgi:hypothetical protein
VDARAGALEDVTRADVRADALEDVTLADAREDGLEDVTQADARADVTREDVRADRRVDAQAGGPAGRLEEARPAAKIQRVRGLLQLGRSAAATGLPAGISARSSDHLQNDRIE